jgi:hypothetical protein
MLNPLLSMWAGMGVLSYILMSIQDIRTLHVDDRKNSFMLGATLMLFAVYPKAWWVALALIGVSIGLTIFLNRFKVMGPGDISALRWNILAFGILGTNILITYCVVFVSVTLLYYGLKKLVRIPINTKTAFIPVMGIIFTVVVFYFGLY